MTGRNLYSRRISSEEAPKCYIFVLKNRLTFFPPLGRSFNLTPVHAEGPIYLMNTTSFAGRELKAKDRVEIREDTDKRDGYIIQIRQ